MSNYDEENNYIIIPFFNSITICYHIFIYNFSFISS